MYVPAAVAAYTAVCTDFRHMAHAKRPRLKADKGWSVKDCRRLRAPRGVPGYTVPYLRVDYHMTLTYNIYIHIHPYMLIYEEYM